MKNYWNKLLVSDSSEALFLGVSITEVTLLVNMETEASSISETMALTHHQRTRQQVAAP